MRDLGLLTDLLSYNNVLGLYALDGRFKAAVGNFKEVVEASVQPDDCTFKSLGIVLVKCGISKKAVGKLEATTKNNYQKGIRSTLLIVKQLDVHCEKPKLRKTILLLWLLLFNTDPAEKPADAFYKFTDTREHSQAYIYGFIWASQTLIVHIEPNENVKKEMNGIDAPARMRMADNEKAEAKKILQIKRAEDDAESNISGLDGM
ncbi:PENTATRICOPEPTIDE REPEAT-CONTAINING PROTEIN 1 MITOCHONDRIAL [Salix purpurea]|uniref:PENTATRICOPEPTIDE REPEAT-CONTAINING PROTEIN 1 MITOCHONDRIAL n=1 Tax=Salix purpurea TaxID=77065 RepID=A0A9Q0WIF0_SALPP|nr:PENTATRICOPEPTIDE REPEAT-CONTAINING PROTEIN 1 MITOCHONDRIAL [Salix purpurea]